MININMIILYTNNFNCYFNNNDVKSNINDRVNWYGDDNNDNNDSDYTISVITSIITTWTFSSWFCNNIYRLLNIIIV